MTVFVCRDEFNSILCGVYDAWMSRLSHENVILETKEEEEGRTLRMFAEYRETEDAEWKAAKVGEAVRKKISREAFAWIYRAAMSCREGKADRIYRFLVKGFRTGGKITSMLGDPDVQEIFSMNRQVANEAHLLTGFLRFSQIRQDFLAAVIGPVNDVTGLLAEHFSDRMSGERWIIYDEKRKKAAFHQPGRKFLLAADLDLPNEWREKMAMAEGGAEYEKLWQTFHESISIAERANPLCQRTHLPLRFRPYMPEFQKKDSGKDLY